MTSSRQLAAASFALVVLALAFAASLPGTQYTIVDAGAADVLAP
jgi:hypothetical protein